MPEFKTMYFNTSTDGWWAYRREDTNQIWSAPQHLKVKVDMDRSAGDRYHFEAVEGPWVIPAVHFRQYQAAAEVYAKGNVSKRAAGRDVLVETNPHEAAARITVSYSRHDFVDYNGLATPVVFGTLTYARVRKEVVMTGDLITPNAWHPISIPDEKHVVDTYRRTDFAAMWFRIDAATAGQNFTGHGQPGDRYFHLGRGSAGCFTNIYTGGNDTAWNSIANTLSRARVGEDQLYVGHIKFEIPNDDLDRIKAGLIQFARDERLSHYVWENAANATPSR